MLCSKKTEVEGRNVILPVIQIAQPILEMKTEWLGIEEGSLSGGENWNLGWKLVQCVCQCGSCHLKLMNEANVNENNADIHLHL